MIYQISEYALISKCRLIATMLSRWRMSVADCLKKYEEVGKEIFKDPRVSLWGWPKARHSKKPLIKAIEDLAVARAPKGKESVDGKYQMFPAPLDLCKT